MARCAVLGVSLGRGLLIPLDYLHPNKCEHSGGQSHPPYADRNDGLISSSVEIFERKTLLI